MLCASQDAELYRIPVFFAWNATDAMLRRGCKAAAKTPRRHAGRAPFWAWYPKALIFLPEVLGFIAFKSQIR